MIFDVWQKMSVRKFLVFAGIHGNKRDGSVPE